MATTVARLQAVLGADTREFDRNIDRSDRRLEQSRSNIGRYAKFAVLGLGAAGAAGAVMLLRRGFDELAEAQRVSAQTDAVLKSTAGAAKVTKEEIEGLASALMRKSGVDDEAIQSGENMLLTFTRIRNEVGAGNDIFNQATKATLDLSVAMGKDMQSSAILVGKALNDPIKGMTALGRAGIQFTEDQKELIKSLVASGKTMDAQKMILRELETQFGGSAEAAGKTMPGQLSILRESFNNVAGDLAAKFLPLLTDLVSWVNDHWREISATIDAVFTAVSFSINSILRPAITTAVTVVRSIVDWVRANWPEISRVTREVFDRVREIVETVTGVVRGIWSRFGDEIVAQIRTNLNLVRGTFENVFQVIRGVFEIFHGLFTGDWREMWNGIRNVFGGIVSQIVLTFRTMGETLRNLASALMAALLEIVTKGLHALAAPWVSLGDWIWDGLQEGWAGMVKNVRAAFAAIRDWIKEHVVDAIVDAFKDIPNRIKDALTGLADKATGAIGSVAGKLNPFGDAADSTMTGPFTGSLMGALPVMGPFAALAAANGLVVTSGLRPGARTAHGTLSDHAVGKALDVAGPMSGMASFFMSLIGNRAVKQAFYDPLGSIFGGARSSYVEGGHSDHVHVATYDRGGWLQPGWNLAYNGLGRPEPVGAAAAGNITINFPNYIGNKQELIDWIRGALLVEQYRGRSITP